VIIDLFPCHLATLGAIDWGVVALYALALVGTGIWLSKRQGSGEDYFLAGRSMPAWAVAISVLATTLSAATFVGGPQQAYAGDLSYLSASIGTIGAATVVAFVFLPAFYAERVTTVYELLERRCGAGAKQTASAMFMLGRVAASGARIYIAAHALSFVAFGSLEPWPLAISCVILAFTGVVYTVAGGIATVIWTDVVQMVVFLGAIAIAGAILASRVFAQTGGVEPAFAALAEADKLTLLSGSVRFEEPYTLWTALTGFALLNIAAYGADQDLAQRMLTCKGPKQAARSMIGSALAGLPVTALFMGLGLLLFLSEPTSPGEYDGANKTVGPFLHFMTTGLPPGVGGVLVAGIFAAGLSSLDSALNAMSSAFVTDFYRKARPARSERHYLTVARLGVAGCGLVLGGFACFCVWYRQGSEGTLLDFALGVMVYAYAGLAGVFLCVLTVKRGGNASAMAGLLTGLALTVGMEVTDRSLKDGLPFAFPWRLVIAAGVSFGVCAIGRARSDYA